MSGNINGEFGSVEITADKVNVWTVVAVMPTNVKFTTCDFNGVNNSDEDIAIFVAVTPPGVVEPQPKHYREAGRQGGTLEPGMPCNHTGWVRTPGDIVWVKSNKVGLCCNVEGISEPI